MTVALSFKSPAQNSGLNYFIFVIWYRKSQFGSQVSFERHFCWWLSGKGMGVWLGRLYISLDMVVLWTVCQTFSGNRKGSWVGCSLYLWIWWFCRCFVDGSLQLKGELGGSCVLLDMLVFLMVCWWFSATEKGVGLDLLLYFWKQ